MRNEETPSYPGEPKWNQTIRSQMETILGALVDLNNNVKDRDLEYHREKEKNWELSLRVGLLEKEIECLKKKRAQSLLRQKKRKKKR